MKSLLPNVVSRTSTLERGSSGLESQLEVKYEELTSLLTIAKYIPVQTGRNILDQP